MGYQRKEIPQGRHKLDEFEYVAFLGDMAGDLAKRGWQVKVDVISLTYHYIEFCQGSNFFTTQFLIRCRQLSKEMLLQI